MSDPSPRNQQPPACPDCNGHNITQAPTESRMTWQCEECGRTFDED